MEAGAIGEGCLDRDAPDDVHVLRDRLAVIQPGDDAGPLPGAALLISSLRPVGPFMFLNVSLGDSAELSERKCGCPLESVGWTTHLRAIRSREKLTAWGMSLLDSDVVRVLEETLPARFGGGPTHYQLVEDADGAGAPRLRLLVHPGGGRRRSDPRSPPRSSRRSHRGAGPSGSPASSGADAGAVEGRAAAPAGDGGKIHHVHAGAAGAAEPFSSRT